MYKKLKSRLQDIVDNCCHMILMSSKYYSKCAGNGIKYCFGWCKWWYKKYNSESASYLRDNPGK